MQKLIVLAALLFVPSFAQATPAVGDTVEFSGSLGEIRFKQEILLFGFDESLQKYGKRTTTYQEGQDPQVADEAVDATSLLSDAQLEFVVAHCAEQGGVAETLTVAAGTFETCKIRQDDGSGFTWLGKVPFGIVKAEAQMTLGVLSMELTRFTRGQ